jgi:putative phosphoesterase
MMRIAVVSDIHGNLSAFEAVLADLRETSPDLIFHGGDLADSGASPLEIVDHIRDLGWPGVAGNTDEMLFRPESLEEFASQSSAPPALWSAIREMAAASRALLGEERIAWLRDLPRSQIQSQFALVHASLESLWRAPTAEATDAELASAYAALDRPIVVYGHIHRPFVRILSNAQSADRLVVNSGSVGLPYNGDRRASYVLLDELTPIIRRVEYDMEKELRALSSAGLPHSDWIVKTLRAASPQLP